MAEVPRAIRRGGMAAGAAAALLAMTSCGGNGNKDPNTTPNTTPNAGTCEALLPDKWLPIRADANPADVKAIAEGLHVTNEQVRAGKFGPVICKQAFTLKEVDHDVIVSVARMSEECILVDFLDVSADPKKPQHEFVALCAAALGVKPAPAPHAPSGPSTFS
jgi:hypothetical protein